MTLSSSGIDLLRAEQRIYSALANPAFSRWLKDTLHGALERDPVWLANDLELLTHLLRPWCEARMTVQAAPARPARCMDTLY